MNYETVIGLEVHVHLKTKSKLFCGCSTEFGSVPNSNICPVCTQLEDSEEGEDFCDGIRHGENLAKRINEAEDLAKLVSVRDSIELGRKLFGKK